MSGGHFDYKQYQIGQIADEIEQLIISNEDSSLNEYGSEKGRFYSQKTIDEFKKSLVILKQAQIYAQRIDYLVSGDDSEESFHNRLECDLLES